MAGTVFVGLSMDVSCFGHDRRSRQCEVSLDLDPRDPSRFNEMMIDWALDQLRAEAIKFLSPAPADLAKAGA